MLRVLTYNIHHGADRRGRLDLARIAGTIAGCEPDVVALQEVDLRWGPRSGDEDQPGWLGQRLGMNVHFTPNVVKDSHRASPAPSGYGLALLSRWPLTAVTHGTFSVPSPEHGEPRGFLQATVHPDVPSGGRRNVRVLNTHLSAAGAGLRRAQVLELLQHLGPAEQPTVIAGDFNARPRSEPIRRLRRHYQDAWRPGIRRGATIRGRRIDYLWVSAQLRPVRTRVVRSTASDHLPVVTDLEWV